MKPLALSCALLMVVTLSACRDDEQGRPLQYQKGEYGGPPDTALTHEEREVLRHRSRLQNYSATNF